jgi:hypothetical protein
LANTGLSVTKMSRATITITTSTPLERSTTTITTSPAIRVGAGHGRLLPMVVRATAAGREMRAPMRIIIEVTTDGEAAVGIMARASGDIRATGGIRRAQGAGRRRGLLFYMMSLRMRKSEMWVLSWKGSGIADRLDLVRVELCCEGPPHFGPDQGREAAARPQRYVSVCRVETHSDTDRPPNRLRRVPSPVGCGILYRPTLP